MPAVLTGDFIGSTKAGAEALEESFGLLRHSAQSFEGWYDMPLRLTRFRGDGWQVLVPDARYALRVAVALSAGISPRKGLLKTRIAMGLGPVDSIGTADLSDASGSAFIRSGRLIDHLPRQRRLVVAPEDTPPLLPALVALADALVQDWTPARAEAVFPLLSATPPTQGDVARTLGISPQSLADRLSEARFWALEEALLGLEHSPSQETPSKSGLYG